MAIYSGFSHEKWWFSIAMLVHQSVIYYTCSTIIKLAIHLIPWFILGATCRRGWKEKQLPRQADIIDTDACTSIRVCIYILYISLYVYIYIYVIIYIYILHIYIYIYIYIYWFISCTVFFFLLSSFFLIQVGRRNWSVLAMACPMFLGHGHHHLNWHAGMGVGLQYLQYVACVLLLIENILSVFFTYIRCESATSQNRSAFGYIW